MSNLKLISSSNTESPVLLDDFKNHIGFSTSDETRDDAFSALLEAATDDAQSFTGLQFLPAQYEQYFSEYNQAVELDMFPVTGINQVKYFDAGNGENILVSGTDYYIELNSNPAKVHFINSFTPYAYREDAIVIQFGAGYESAAKVPPLIKAAILLAAANMYVNPADSVQALPTASRNLLKQYRCHRY